MKNCLCQVCFFCPAAVACLDDVLSYFVIYTTVKLYLTELIKKKTCSFSYIYNSEHLFKVFHSDWGINVQIITHFLLYCNLLAECDFTVSYISRWLI